MNGCLGWLALAAGAAAMVLLIPYEWIPSSPTERQALERRAHLERALRELSPAQIAREVGRARIYEHFCDMWMSPTTLATVLEAAEMNERDLEQGGRLRREWEYGAFVVAEIFFYADGDPSKIEFACLLGTASYGTNGFTVPLLEIR